MATIKITKEMNFPELINYIQSTLYKPNKYFTKNKRKYIQVGNFQGITLIESNNIYPNDIFLVEFEEKITEETVISRLLEVRNAIPSEKEEWQDLKILKSYLYGNYSISEVKNEHSVAFYILNDDMTMTLIWKDGKLVD